LPWCMPIEERMTNKALEEEWWLKNKGTWMP
jgi:hypothetical protein